MILRILRISKILRVFRIPRILRIPKIILRTKLRTPNGIKKTGDYAEFDSRGRLKVLGKASDRVTLLNGLNYNPNQFEEALLNADLKGKHLLEDVVVLGDGQERLGCVFFFREPKKYLDYSNELTSSTSRSYLENLIRRHNKARSIDEQIGHWSIHPEPIRDTAFIGPSGKLRRRLVEEEYQNLFKKRRLEKTH